MVVHREPDGIGARIRAARLIKGWSQAQLHLAAGVALSDISKIETGRLLPSRTQLKRLAPPLDLTDHDVGLVSVAEDAPHRG